MIDERRRCDTRHVVKCVVMKMLIISVKDIKSNRGNSVHFTYCPLYLLTLNAFLYFPFLVLVLYSLISLKVLGFIESLSGKVGIYETFHNCYKKEWFFH